MVMVVRFRESDAICGGLNPPYNTTPSLDDLQANWVIYSILDGIQWLICQLLRKMSNLQPVFKTLASLQS